VFGELIDVRPVTNSNGLVRKYLSKERTPQAGYGREHLLGGRLRGSHRLEGGGDRVRLSRALERDAIEAGYVDAWQHSNARRSFERRAYRPRRAPPPEKPPWAGHANALRDHNPLSSSTGKTRGANTEAYADPKKDIR